MKYLSWLLLSCIVWSQQSDLRPSTGSVTGQLRCLTAEKDTLTAKCIVDETRGCDDQVRFGATTKYYRDLFPEECKPTEMKLNIDDTSSSKSPCICNSSMCNCPNTAPLTVDIPGFSTPVKTETFGAAFDGAIPVTCVTKDRNYGGGVIVKTYPNGTKKFSCEKVGELIVRWSIGKDTPNVYPVPKPEPTDIPAIRPTHEVEYEVFDSDYATCKEYPYATALYGRRTFVCKREEFQPWTCADKIRVLLHDEQNPPKYWCHRVEGSKD